MGPLQVMHFQWVICLFFCLLVKLYVCLMSSLYMLCTDCSKDVFDITILHPIIQWFSAIIIQYNWLIHSFISKIHRHLNHSSFSSTSKSITFHSPSHSCPTWKYLFQLALDRQSSPVAWRHSAPSQLPSHFCSMTALTPPLILELTLRLVCWVF